MRLFFGLATSKPHRRNEVTWEAPGVTNEKTFEDGELGEGLRSISKNGAHDKKKKRNRIIGRTEGQWEKREGGRGKKEVCFKKRLTKHRHKRKLLPTTKKTRLFSRRAYRVNRHEKKSVKRKYRKK